MAVMPTMSSEEIVRYVLSFLGGGVVSGLIAWVRENALARKRAQVERRRQQRQDESERIESQLRLLYGPLHFFTTQAVQLLHLVGGIDTAYHEQPIDAGEAAATIDLSNRYVARIDENNDKVMAILESQWSLIDLDDSEVFARFQVDHTRMRSERRLGSVVTPLLIFKRIGNISYMRQEFVDRVDEKFRRKRDRLERLSTTEEDDPATPAAQDGR